MRKGWMVIKMQSEIEQGITVFWHKFLKQKKKKEYAREARKYVFILYLEFLYRSSDLSIHMNRIEIFLLFFSSPSLFLLKQRERKSIISRKCKQNIMKIKQIIKFSSLSKFTSWIDKMQAFDIGVEQNWTWFNNFLFKDNLKNYIHKHIVLVIIFFIIQKFTWKCAANVFSSSKASDWIFAFFCNRIK